MSRAHRSLVPLLMLTLVACAGIETSTNYDPTAMDKLSGYRTYSWLPQPRGQENTRVYNPIVETRVKQAVDQELASRGYRKVEQNPDFQIGWQGAIDKKLDVQTVDRYYGYSWGSWYSPYYMGAVAPETYVREYEQGTLILDIVDASSNQLVWRGTAQAELSSSSSVSKRQERLNEAVHDTLKDFPPKAEK